MYLNLFPSQVNIRQNHYNQNKITIQNHNIGHMYKLCPHNHELIRAISPPSRVREVEQGKLHKDQGTASAAPEPFEDQVDTSPRGFYKAAPQT